MSQNVKTRFIKELSKRNLTVAFAESMTCGLAMHQLTKVKGTMNVLQGGIVCYHEKIKIEVLKVPRKLIQTKTAESEAVTERITNGLASLISADIYAGVTGLAGAYIRDRPQNINGKS